VLGAGYSPQQSDPETTTATTTINIIIIINNTKLHLLRSLLYLLSSATLLGFMGGL
jgi:hypothetical protein